MFWFSVWILIYFLSFVIFICWFMLDHWGKENRWEILKILTQRCCDTGGIYERWRGFSPDWRKKRREVGEHIREWMGAEEGYQIIWVVLGWLCHRTEKASLLLWQFLSSPYCLCIFLCKWILLLIHSPLFLLLIPLPINLLLLVSINFFS